MNRDTGIFDGLRGFMALWVLIGHCAGASALNIPVINSPATAVDVFMLISGFLMAWNYMKRENREPWDSASTVAKFYIRRFWRISPLYYLALAFIYLTGFGTDPARQNGTGTDIFLHVTYLFGLFPQTASNNILPDWSLSLEVQFYALFPFLMLFVRRFGDLTFAVCCIATYALASRFIAVSWEAPAAHAFVTFDQPSVLPLRICFFAIGMLSARLAANQAAAPARSAMILAIGVMAAYQQVLVVTITLVLVLSVIFDDSGRRFGNATRPLLDGIIGRYLGRVSYGVYLTHTLFLAAAERWLDTISWFSGAGHAGQFGVLLICVLVPSLICAEIAYRLIEAPGIALGRYLTSGAGAPRGLQVAD